MTGDEELSTSFQELINLIYSRYPEIEAIEERIVVELVKGTPEEDLVPLLQENFETKSRAINQFIKEYKENANNNKMQ